MADLSSLFFGLLLTSLLFSPAFSLTCAPNYSNCTDLPVLKASFHYTYYPTNSTLSFAFFAPPPNPNGWVAWAINPTATGMAGSQAFLAYKDSNGSVLLKTYNVVSYKEIKESKLSFDVLNQKAEFSKGSFSIYATVVLPKNTTSINHVWQVGPGVKNGMPEKHDFGPDNLAAKSVLKLTENSNVSPPASTPAPSPADGGKENGSGGLSSNRLLLVSMFVFAFLYGRSNY